MKEYSLFLFSLVFIFNSYSQNKKVKLLKQEYLPITDSIFAAKYETSYGEYWIFLNSIAKNESIELYNECYIDTSKLISEYVLPFYEMFQNRQTIINYPISNISYKAAIEYCKWLTDNYNNNPNKKYKKVVFRLPSEREWELAASGGMSFAEYPWGGPYIRDKSGKFLCNFFRLVETNISYDTLAKKYVVINQGEYSLPNISTSLLTINSYKPNNFGLYNMSGNVAEMVAENCIAKGGSYLDPGYDVQIKRVKKYTEKASNIGFRVLMQVIESNK